jgi:hypothetical protein
MQCNAYIMEYLFIHLFLFSHIFVVMILQEIILCFFCKSCPRCGLMHLLLWYWQLTR